MSKELLRPTDIEDAQINAAALTDAELKQFKRGRGRPIGSGKEEQVTLRLDAEILEQFKAIGNGWQTRINEALRDWATYH